MQIILYLPLLLIVKHQTLGMNVETKAAAVGEDVMLTCDRPINQRAKLFWVRLISGHMPEVLGGTYSYDYDGVIQNPHFVLKQEPGVFLLHIIKTDYSDTGVYYCISVDHPFVMIFLKETVLSIKGPNDDITRVQLQLPPSHPDKPGESVTLWCSVLSDSESQTCPEYHRLYWFRAESDGSKPSLISVHGNSSSSNECENRTEVLSPSKCVYNFCKTVSSSDAGIHYCAVSTCAEILFGRGTKAYNEELGTSHDAQIHGSLLLLLCAALSLSLTVNAFLIYFIVKKTCDCCKDRETTAVDRNQQTQQRDENSLVYSVPTFTGRKFGKAQRGNENAAEEETVYTKVRASPRH